MNTKIKMVKNSSNNEITKFEQLTFGDYFLYKTQLYQKTNGTGEINAVQVNNGCHARFKSLHYPIKLVKEVNIQYVI